MALETLKDVKEIGGFEVSSLGIEFNNHIKIDHDLNIISFRIQNGPIREVGVNGCSIDCLIEAAKMIIEGLNKKFPCQENYNAISRLEDVLMWLEKRTKDREKRGVEGTHGP